MIECEREGGGREGDGEGGRWGEGGEINIIEKRRESEGRDIWRNGKGRARGQAGHVQCSKTLRQITW